MNVRGKRALPKADNRPVANANIQHSNIPNIIKFATSQQSTAAVEAEAGDEIRIVRLDPQSFPTEQQLLETTYKKLESIGYGAQWVPEKDLQTTVLPNQPNVVYVVWPFSGQAFQYLTQNKCRIYGPCAILSSLEKNRVLPNQGERPCANPTLWNKLICCSNLDKAKKAELYEKVEMLGGRWSKELVKECNLLVSGTVGSEKYFAAAQQRIPIVTADFVEQAWQRSTSGQSDVDIAALIRECALPIFKGFNMTVSQVPPEDRARIRDEIIQNGGLYCADLKLRSQKDQVNLDIKKFTTHVICSIPSGAKYDGATRCKLPVVLPNWISRSVAEGYCLDWNKFLLEPPKPVLVPAAAEPIVIAKGPRATSTPQRHAKGLNVSLDVSSIPAGADDDITVPSPLPAIKEADEAENRIHAEIPAVHTNILPIPCNLPFTHTSEPLEVVNDDMKALNICNQSQSSQQQIRTASLPATQPFRLPEPVGQKAGLDALNDDDDADCFNAAFDDYVKTQKPALPANDATKDEQEAAREESAAVENAVIPENPSAAASPPVGAPVVQQSEKESLFRNAPEMTKRFLASKFPDLKFNNGKKQAEGGISAWLRPAVDVRSVTQQPIGSPRKPDPRGGVFYSQTSLRIGDRMIAGDFFGKSRQVDSEPDTESTSSETVPPHVHPIRPVVSTAVGKETSKPTERECSQKSTRQIEEILKDMLAPAKKARVPLIASAAADASIVLVDDDEEHLAPAIPIKKVPTAGVSATPETVLILSGFTSVNDKNYLFAKLKEMRVKYLDKNEYDEKCTHLIVNSLARNEKFLACVAAGKWVLHPSFLHDSIQNQKLMPPEMYEYGNKENARSIMDSLKRPAEKTWAGAAYFWRRKIKRDGVRAFHGWKVVLDCAEGRLDGYVRLLQAGGAEVMATSLPFTGKLKGVTHFIYEAVKTPRVTEAEINRFINAGVQVEKSEFLANFICEEPYGTFSTAVPEEEPEYIPEPKEAKSGRRSNNDKQQPAAKRKRSK